MRRKTPDGPTSLRRWMTMRKMLAVSLLLTVALSACSNAVQDPRAYPGSQGRSLEYLLHRFQLELPSCNITGLRYYSSSSGMSEGLELTFSVPADCMSRFLRSVGAYESYKEQLTGDAVPIPRETIKQLNWPIDPSKTYDTYGALLITPASFRIVIDRSGAQPVAYLSGFR